jgi:hypothetical protein
VDLRRHIGDATIKMPGQYGSWPVVGPAAAVPFRAFRLVLAGPTTSATSPYNLCLSHLELYGYFYVAGGGEGEVAAAAEGGGAAAAAAGGGSGAEGSAGTS